MFASRQQSLISILIYSIVFLTIIQLLHITYYKLKYPFWNKLSGFHSYQWWYWLLKEQTLNTIELSRESKYYNKNYETIKLDDNTNNSIIDFINEHFMNYKDAKHKITKQQLSNIVSENTYVTTSLLEEATLNGIIISMPFLFWSKNFNLQNNKENAIFKYKSREYSFNKINYVDYLCVHKKYRNKNIASSLIYTHLLNVNPNPNTNSITNPTMFLFKNEGFKTKALVPLLNYSGYVTDLENVDLNSCQENISILKSNHCRCNYLEPKNSKQLTDFINIIYNIHYLERCNIEFISLYSKELLIKHIKTNEILVYTLKYKDEIIGFYIFKNINSLIDDTKYEFISCCSLNLRYESGFYMKSFIWGFKIACVLCKTRLNNLYCSDTNTKQSYDLCCIEDIAHNNDIIHKTGINNINKHIYKIPLHYYMYNGLIHTKKSRNAFILS